MKRKRDAVGVIGLGIMGGSFARHLVAAGRTVHGYDIDPKSCRAAVRAGVTICNSVEELAAAAPIIITSLPSPAALHKTAAAIAQSKTPRLVVEASTFSLEDKLKAERTLRRAGHIMLDCPISGTGAQARTKDIVVYASGDPKAIKRVTPVFADFSRGVHNLGAFGNGSRMKYVANLLVAIHNVATAEAMVLGMKAGLDPAVVFDTVRTGAGNSRVFELRGPKMVADRYDEATMKISVWQKDMKIIAAFAKSLRVPTPLFSATAPIYDEALAAGHGEDDTAAVCAVMEKQARVRRTANRSKRG